MMKTGIQAADLDGRHNQFAKIVPNSQPDGDGRRQRVAYPGSSEIGYSLLVRRVMGARSRSALPPRFSVIFEYGGLIP
jgi:hypothetical protein